MYFVGYYSLIIKSNVAGMSYDKKSYLICVEFSKYYVIKFFSKYKTEIANRAETSARR